MPSQQLINRHNSANELTDNWSWTNPHFSEDNEAKRLIRLRRINMARHTRTTIIISCLVIAIVALGIGVLTGYFGRPSGKSSGQFNDLVKEADKSISEKLMNEIKAENIKRYLRNLTAHPHLAGTPADEKQARELEHFWKHDVGMDQVDIVPYNVLLSYPEKKSPNVIELLDGSDAVIFRSQLNEKILRPDEDQPDVVPPFNAYSAPGTLKGDLIYVNYARVEDFMWLTNNTLIDVTGKLVIARYGKIFRGDKVQVAAGYGAIGILLYSDPADYVVDLESGTYPDSWWMPGTAVQRGSLFISSGDPLTPQYPSIDSAYRLPESEANLPRIPAHPIGYDDAKIFLGNMTGEEAPPEWRGKLPITYRLGPGFTNSTWKVKMKISTHNQNATTYNVIGFIKGSVEPDRYVIIGNHRDAWVFGAVDPSSATAGMMELSRAMCKLVKEGWRPRRTIIFCSWGAEEYGLIGSVEWIENYIKTLGERAVAYLNVDITVQGNFSLRALACPLMYKPLIDSTKKIPNPDPSEVADGRKTVYDTWAYRLPAKDKNGNSLGRPIIGKLGSGSDYKGFLQLVGIPSLDQRYTFDPILGISSYPLYHSVYETFHLVSEIMDKSFEYHKATTRVWGELAWYLSDSLIIPFNVMDYADALERFTQELLDGYGQLMKDNGLQSGIGHLQNAVTEFKKACQNFADRLPNVDKTNPVVVRMMNDQMMQLERAFTDPNGLPGRVGYRHILFAPSSHNSYAGDSFPGLVDAMFDIENAQNTTARWDAVKRHLSVVVFTIKSAASTLQEVTMIHKNN